MFCSRSRRLIYIYIYIYIYLHLNQNTREAENGVPKGAPVGPGPEGTGGGAAIKKTLENVTFGGLSGVGQTGATGSLWSKFRGVHFGAVLGGPLGPFWDPCGVIILRASGWHFGAPVGCRSGAISAFLHSGSESRL